MDITLPIPTSPHCRPHLHFRHLSAGNHRHPFLRYPNSHHRNLSLSISASQSSSPSSSSSLENPLPTGRFVTNEDLEKLDFLGKYSYHHQLESGLLWVRVMREDEIGMTLTLLSESFAESMMMATGYVKLLEFLVKDYLMERREAMPYCATLLAVYRENGEEDFELAGTVELTFEKKGANSNLNTPTPPKNSPYICNMAVRKPLRRRGIGWHLLKAGEELITKMSSSREVYLHCRIIDEGPFNMYMKAGYKVVKTDSILTLLTLQRRKHLMCKELPIFENGSDQDITNEELTSSEHL